MTAKIRTYHIHTIYQNIYIYNVHNIFVEFGDAKPTPPKNFREFVGAGPSLVVKLTFSWMGSRKKIVHRKGTCSEQVEKP